MAEKLEMRLLAALLVLSFLILPGLLALKLSKLAQAVQ
jgi:ABC-type Mn2+/Zn2+ transport system permease subunit